ncbi:hypothetical protein LIER_22969 [Lithospermum erythrorhizon]|uniref:Uncharacterized protein n=1 Tax=Lithospermum erythrorhizon TaxID=34254 RepID=A0AAV3QYX7_LITER
MQARYEALEPVNTSEILKAFKALEQANKDKDAALESAAGEAEAEHIHYAKELYLDMPLVPTDEPAGEEGGEEDVELLGEGRSSPG